ncbi:MAG TPA: orotidine-5'-phosphate decarboxylase [Calditrichaeota bacterium]|nr:orotidine-5'-phosphate decarboxylase [Calditrichota bacterium]
MKAAQVITAVEDFIRQSLVHAYPLFGKEEYPLLNDKIVRQDGRIKVDGHIFQIPSCKSPEIDRLQIPQTRFVFYTISTENGKVTILRLLSTILVSLDTIGKKETVSVELAQGWRVALLEDVRHLITKKNMVFETSSKGVFILSTDSIAINTDKIPQLLTRLKAKEQSIHPLIHSNVNNKMIMQEIDRIWTQLYPFIGQDKDIGKAELGAEPEIILWLQEIYIYFGWYKELRKFYANKETFEGNNIAKMANSRYRIVVSDLNPDKPIDKPVIADFKIADVPHISKIITRIAVNGGCDGVIVHGFVGPDSIEACIIEAKENMVFVATELTSLGGKYFTQPVANDLATMAKEIGAYGIQVPGNRPERIKKIRQLVGNELTIISCGIGAQGGKFGSAIKAGADFEIIGRAIYDSENPEIKIKEIKADTTKAML